LFIDAAGGVNHGKTVVSGDPVRATFPGVPGNEAGRTFPLVSRGFPLLFGDVLSRIILKCWDWSQLLDFGR
jgi:hypothetical protein